MTVGTYNENGLYHGLLHKNLKIGTNRHENYH